MQPQIRYVRSADGTRIAMATFGEGQPLVFVHNFYISIELLWEIPEAVENVERLARKRKVVLYDARGAGLSAQDINDFSLDAHVADLETVVDSLDSPVVDLAGTGPTTPTVIAFAARHADKVRRISLQEPVARSADLFPDERRLALQSLIQSDWSLYLQCLALVNFGWTDIGRRVAERQMKEASQSVWIRSAAEWSNLDVSDLMPAVVCPALVLAARSGRRGLAKAGAAVDVAAALPNARLVRVDLYHSILLAGTWDASLGTIEAFLDEDAPPAEVDASHGTAIIFFADIVDSTVLTERMGDAAFRKKARDLDGALRAIIKDNSGTPIEGKLLGDGVLATFSSASQAIAAALSCGTAGENGGLPLHLGLHAGDVIREDNNVFGGAVNVAARISGLSAPGEVLVSDTVRSLARTSAGVSFEDRGEQELKGVGEAVRVWAVLREPQDEREGE